MSESAIYIGQVATPGRVWSRRSRRAFRFLREWPILPVLIIVLVIVAGVFSPWLTPHDPLRGNLLEVRVPPFWAEGGSSKYLLGTDPLGRDIFSRLIEGARVSLTVASIVLGIGAISGVTLGMIAGYFGGQLDEIIMRIVDFALAVPFILVALVVVIVLGQSLAVIIALLAFFSWPGFARQVRAETLTLKRRDYVALAQIAGASPERILFRHILPGVTNTAVVVATLRVGQLILVESTLSFLGVGIPPPTPAWGSMTADGRDYLLTEWWISFFPGLAIVIVVASLNFFGDWLRDYLDPRLRQIGH